MESLLDIIRDVRRGMIPASIYSDPALFELEKRRLFARAWMFMAHESEIPEPGDYVVRRIVDDQRRRRPTPARLTSACRCPSICCGAPFACSARLRWRA